MAAYRPTTDGDGDSGAQFAEQLNGLTAAAPDPGAWPVNLQQTAEDATAVPQAAATLATTTPAVAQPILSGETQLPGGSTIDSGVSAWRSAAPLEIQQAAEGGTLVSQTAALPAPALTADSSQPRTNMDGTPELASQVSGQTVVTLDTGAWRSSGPADFQQTTGSGTVVTQTTALPATVQSSLPYQVRLSQQTVDGATVAAQTTALPGVQSSLSYQVGLSLQTVDGATVAFQTTALPTATATVWWWKSPSAPRPASWNS